MSLLSMLMSNGPTGYGYGSTAEGVTESRDLSGRTILVTGVNSGLGAETLRVLTMRGAHVVGTARTVEKAELACADYGAQATPIVLELSEPSSVLHAVESVTESCPPLDAIITNAGVMSLPTRTVKHGLEMQFLTNHVGHFMLVTGLLPRLCEDGRVISVSSEAHKTSWREGIRFDDLDAAKQYAGWRAYGQSKLANLLFARHLSTRLGAGQAAIALHPGVILTNLWRHMPIPGPVQPVLQGVGNLVGMKNVEQGAATQVFTAIDDSVYANSGAYYADCNVATSSKHGLDSSMAARLWEVTESLVAEF